jgi:hypothetical protein
LGGRQADALQWAPAEDLEALERQREVGAALGGHERVDLVDDHRVDRAEDVAGVRREQQVERLGGGDEDVGRLALEAGAFACRRVAGAHGDGGDVVGVTARERDVGDAGERGAQVAFHVDGEGLERRDVEHAAAARRVGHRLEHQAVDAGEEGGERLAAAGRGQQQRGGPGGDGRPGLGLGPGGCREGLGEPGADGRVERGEGVGHDGASVRCTVRGSGLVFQHLELLLWCVSVILANRTAEGRSSRGHPNGRGTVPYGTGVRSCK